MFQKVISLVGRKYEGCGPGGPTLSQYISRDLFTFEKFEILDAVDSPKNGDMATAEVLKEGKKSAIPVTRKKP